MKRKPGSLRLATVAADVSEAGIESRIMIVRGNGSGCLEPAIDMMEQGLAARLAR